ncbi:unnamed protein product [Musa acuminata subsp. burmannicoides]
MAEDRKQYSGDGPKTLSEQDKTIVCSATGFRKALPRSHRLVLDVVHLQSYAVYTTLYVSHNRVGHLHEVERHMASSSLQATPTISMRRHRLWRCLVLYM